MGSICVIVCVCLCVFVLYLCIAGYPYESLISVVLFACSASCDSTSRPHALSLFARMMK